ENGLSAAGFSFFGAVYLVPIGLVLCSGFLGIKKTDVLDAIAPGLASIVSFMRLGCFSAGCCGGWEAEILNIRFRWPTQAIESVGDFFVLGLLLQMDILSDEFPGSIKIVNKTVS
ncbi:MAG: prolipoprotein diacylglyceryl transferase, partial [Oscillospiraceae bacterium]|nr:prolipoprotein diacylglyceryl transferase [Oscillospiraceae bacterium]